MVFHSVESDKTMQIVVGRPIRTRSSPSAAGSTHPDHPSSSGASVAPVVAGTGVAPGVTVPTGLTVATAGAGGTVTPGAVVAPSCSCALVAVNSSRRRDAGRIIVGWVCAVIEGKQCPCWGLLSVTVVSQWRT